MEQVFCLWFISVRITVTVKLKQWLLQFQLSVHLSHKTGWIPTIKDIKTSHNCDDVSLQKCMHTLTKGNLIFSSNTWSIFTHFPASLVLLPWWACVREPQQEQNTCSSTEPHPHSTRRPGAWKMGWARPSVKARNAVLCLFYLLL